MKLRLPVIVAVFAFALSATGAFAQGVGLYWNPVAERVTTVNDPGLYSFLGAGQTSRFFWGFAVGGFYDFLSSGKIEGGLDLRDTYLNANNASLNKFELGPRISYNFEGGKLKPYLQPVIGEGYSRSPHTEVHIKKVDYGVYFGADYKIHKHVDFRAFEIGYGSVVTASDATIGGTASVPAAKQYTISTGLVFRIP